MLMDRAKQDFEYYVSLAEHYKAVGETLIYLHSEGEKPWKMVVKAEPGGSHRLDISTDVRFTALHPCGITFSWSFDLEPRHANGKSGYYIDTEGIAEVLRKLPTKARAEFSTYLLNIATAVEKKAREYEAEYQRQSRDAKAILLAVGRNQ